MRLEAQVPHPGPTPEDEQEGSACQRAGTTPGTTPRAPEEERPRPFSDLPPPPPDVVPAGEVYDWYVRGVDLLDNGDTNAAVQLLVALRARPSRRAAQVREALARAQFDVGMYDEARENFEWIISVNPADDYAQFGLGPGRDQGRRPGERRRAPGPGRGHAPRHRLLRHRAARRPRGPDRRPALSAAAGHARSAACDRPLTSAYDAALFDLDGVLYLEEHGVAARRRRASRRPGRPGMRVAYVTNNASRRAGASSPSGSPGSGIPAEPHEVVTSAPGGGARAGRAARRPGARVLVVGTRGARRRGARRRAACRCTRSATPARTASRRSCRGCRPTPASATSPRPRSRCARARCGSRATPT